MVKVTSVSPVQKFELLVAGWTGVTVHPHRFGAREFRLRGVELGHLHPTGELDLPMSRALRNELIAQGMAEPHRWVPDSGWMTFRLGGDADLKRAVWLLRLAYLRQALKWAPDPAELFERERVRLGLTTELVALLEPPGLVAASAASGG